MAALLASAGVAGVPAEAVASSVATWGSNAYGQLGDGLTEAEQRYSDAPVAVSGSGEAVAVAEGCEHRLALLGDGAVLAWGRNNLGQLGNGRQGFGEYSDRPVEVPGVSGATAIAAGCDFSLALLGNGEVRVWGDTVAGDYSDTPVNPGLTGVRAISAGSFHALALLRSGRIMAWGEDSEWQLGYPEVLEGRSAKPHEVEGLANAVGIAAGADFSAALIEGGAVEVWGANGRGQHGSGSTGAASSCFCSRETAERRGYTPTTVTGLSEVAALSAGGYHTLALLADGTVWAWGANPNGELGSAPSAYSDVPIPVEGLSDVAAIAASVSRYSSGEPNPNHNLAILADGAVEAWGVNEEGDLGVGTLLGPEVVAGVSRSVAPVEVVGLTGAHTPAAAGDAALAVAEPAMLVTFASWPAAATLTDAALKQTVTLNGASLSGRGAVHGQAEGALSASNFAAPIKFRGVLPMTLGVSLTAGAIAVSSVSLLGLTVPTSCTTAGAPLSFFVEAPQELTRVRVAGAVPFTMPAFRCHGGFLTEPFGRVLTAMLSGPGNTLTFSAEA